MANSNYIPPEIQSSATAALFSCRKVFLLEKLERAERLCLIHKGYIDALITELGADRYSQYAQARAETRDKLRSLRKSHGLKAEREARIGIFQRHAGEARGLRQPLTAPSSSPRAP